MKFGRFPVGEAAGVVLAHALRAPTPRKKGHVLTAADTAALAAAGVLAVEGARLEPGDVPEDDAAADIAARLAGRNLDVSPARTGRCNLLAAADGVIDIDAAAVNAANAVNEAVTIATLPDKQSVRRGQIVATVKIIPFAVAGDVMAAVARALTGESLRVAAYAPKMFALISTLLPGLKPSVIAATEAVTLRRVADIGGAVVGVHRIAHDSTAVAAQLRGVLDGGADVVLIVGASATADRADVVPTGIVAAGGAIDHFGMPVDPGNLLVLAHAGPAAVLVMPGCARSPRLNGADWVLQRLAAGLPLDGRRIMEMGVGGLLVEAPARPLPRAQAVRSALSSAPSPARPVAAIVLAAGQSRRMGARNKLLMEIGGVPLVRRTVEAALAAAVAPVVVVTGHQKAEVEAVLRGLDVGFVHNPQYAEGLSTSLRAGLEALPPSAAGALVCLGDMPGIAARHLARLVARFDPEADRAIGVPTHGGKRGNPVLWDRRFFQDMRAVAGDVGARHLIGVNESLVYEVEFDDTAVLMDLDTPGQWEDYLSQSSPPRST